jgi:hypothetical protein
VRIDFPAAQYVLTKLAQYRVTFLILHSDDRVREPRRQIEHLAAGARLIVDERMYRPGKGMGTILDVPQFIAHEDLLEVEGSTIHVRDVDREAIRDLEPLGYRREVNGHCFVERDLVDKEGRTALLEQGYRSQKPTMVGLIYIDEIAMERRPRSQADAINFVDADVLSFRVILDIGDFGVRGIAVALADRMGLAFTEAFAQRDMNSRAVDGSLRSHNDKLESYSRGGGRRSHA